MAKQPGARRNPRSNTRKRVGKGGKPTTKLHLNPSILYPTQYRESLRGFPWCNTINCRKSVAGVLVFCFGLVVLCVGVFLLFFFGGRGETSYSVCGSYSLDLDTSIRGPLVGSG